MSISYNTLEISSTQMNLLLMIAGLVYSKISKRKGKLFILKANPILTACTRWIENKRPGKDSFFTANFECSLSVESWIPSQNLKAFILFMRKLK